MTADLSALIARLEAGPTNEKPHRGGWGFVWARDFPAESAAPRQPLRQLESHAAAQTASHPPRQARRVRSEQKPQGTGGVNG